MIGLGYFLIFTQENKEISLNKFDHYFVSQFQSRKDHSFAIEQVFLYMIMASALVLPQGTVLLIYGLKNDTKRFPVN